MRMVKTGMGKGNLKNLSLNSLNYLKKERK
jgi:hypothetical protein